MQATPEGAVRADGRHLRRERSRTAALDALLDLLALGHAVPSTREIAGRAGMTERTLFNLFGDKTTLLAAAVARFRKRALGALPEAPPKGPLEARVQQLVASLAPFFDEYSAVRWAALTHDTAVPDIQRGVVLSAVYSRFDALLTDEGLDSQDDELAAALRAAIDPLTWRQLRVHQRLSRDRAGRALARTVVALLRDAGRR